MERENRKVVYWKFLNQNNWSPQEFGIHREAPSKKVFKKGFIKFSKLYFNTRHELWRRRKSPDQPQTRERSKSPNKAQVEQGNRSEVNANQMSTCTQRNKANFIIFGGDKPEESKETNRESSNSLISKTKYFGKINFNKLNRRKSVEKERHFPDFNTILMPDVLLPPRNDSTSKR
ncbi:unnamed protein product [Moneuplotes crassus]|uniref:Uncharacterized protein n=1 Tax=Euplotes crassus TaxID=5936 RepID=A0AAD1UK53_EUPCR|nr:unnamed protein product [Moneuplotes crassus]